MEVCFLASGEKTAVLDPADVEGTTAKALKQALATKIGATRFRQRLFLEGDAVEIPDDEVLPQCLCLQRFSWWSWNFCPPDVAEDEKIMVAARGNDTVSLEKLLKCP